LQRPVDLVFRRQGGEGEGGQKGDHLWQHGRRDEASRPRHRPSLRERTELPPKKNLMQPLFLPPSLAPSLPTSCVSCQLVPSLTL
jgi:hypothetical protein